MTDQRRRPHKKARSGCITCRKRRVKCDETVPNCKRCERGGRKCGGYEQPRVWEFRSTKSARKHHDEVLFRRTSDTAVGLNQSLVIEWKCRGIDDSDRRKESNATEEDRSALQSEQPKFDLMNLFRNEMEKQFFEYAIHQGKNCYASFEPQAKEFWYNNASQMAGEHVAVRHALIALGATNWLAVRQNLECSTHPSRQSVSILALSQQNAAIRLLKDNKDISGDALIACSMLFFIAALWKCKSPAPTQHLKPGFALLSTDQHPRSLRCTPMLRNIMLPVFKRMLLTAAAWEDDLNVNSVNLNSISLFCPPIPDHFTHLEDCQIHLKMLMERVAIQYRRRDPALYDNLEQRLNEFGAALYQSKSAFIAKDHNGRGLVEVQGLLLHTDVLQMIVQNSRSRNEDYYIETPRFMNLLRRSQDILEQEARLGPVSPGSMMTFGILSPLFFIATKCRVLDLRLQALRLLHTSHRREKRTSSCQAAILAAIVIMHEHAAESACTQTPKLSANVPMEQLVSIKKVWISPGAIRMCAKLEKIEQVVPYDIDIFFNEWGYAQDAVGLPSAKMLDMSLYGGPLLLTPPEACHCHDWQLPVAVQRILNGEVSNQMRQVDASNETLPLQG